MPAEHGDKTEAATPRRRQEARERGHVPRSVELTAAVLLLGAMLLLRYFGPDLFWHLRLLLVGGLDIDAPFADPRDELKRFGAAAAAMLALSLLPILGGLALLSAVSNLGQVGAVFSWNPLTPQAGRLNPLSGLSRIFSLRSLAQLGVNLLKLLLVTWIAWSAIEDGLPQILASLELEQSQFIGLAGQMTFDLGIRLAIVLLLLAVFDFGYHRWQYERDLRMTRQEVKEEMRRMEGDPVLKHRRRQIQMQMAMQRLRRDVPKADVVVTNPTELAIALKYDEKSMRAPVVLAKGADLLARRIRELAIAHGIPIIERKPLAQALYKAVEAGQEIPPHLYQAVAEILAYVYELSGKIKRRRATA